MTTGHPISLEAPFALDTGHFVGYHDVCPWSPDNRWLAAHRATLEGGVPGPDDAAEIVVIEAPPGDAGGGAGAGGRPSDAPRTVASTRAWNWQLGARLQWLPGTEESLLLFNRRDGEEPGAAVVDLEGEVRRELPFPVYAVAPGGRLAATLDFGRLHRLRPGYGYAGAGGAVADPGGTGGGRGDDGLLLGDLETGSVGPLLAGREVARALDDPAFEPAARPCWVEHPTFSPSGGRIAFLFRTRSPDGGLPTRLVVTDPERSEVASPELAQVTHYAWLDDDRLVAWGRDPGSPASLARRVLPDALLRLGRTVTRRFRSGAVRGRVMGDRFAVADLSAGTVEPFGGGALDRDGHPAPSPASDVVLCDSYPDDGGRQRLWIVDPASGARVELGRWDAPRGGGPDRCDLHPRWDRAGRRICVDSAHTGTRRVHVADVSTALEALAGERGGDRSGGGR